MFRSKISAQPARAEATTRRARRGSRAYRPRAEGLEVREVLTLLPGNPLTIPLAATEFLGSGPGTGANSARGQLNAFTAAIGGANNGNTGSPFNSGFRTIDWDAVQVNGNDFGGGANTIVINQGDTIAIPQNRFQTRGVFFDELNAVSDNGFVDVNPAAAGLFTAFSPSNTFAPINDRVIEVSFVVPGGANAAPTPAATRGFGAIFLGNQIAAASSIRYFSGETVIRTVTVPTAGPGDASFAGALFNDPVVTRVELVVGSAVLFSFNGATDAPVGNIPTTLVATDDFAYAEPVARPLGSPLLPGAPGTGGQAAPPTATVGAAFNGVVATFADTDAINTTTASTYSAVINWGDGTISNGTVTRNAQGGFDVAGTRTFARAGTFPVTVHVEKFETDPARDTDIDLTNVVQVASAATAVTLTASSTSPVAGQAVTLTATVAGPAGTTPTGTVTFLNGTTVLGTVAVGANGTATLSTTSLGAGTQSITAVYNGDAGLNASTSAAVAVTVRTNVTSQVTVTLGRVRRRGARSVLRVDIRNNGDALPGPVILVLDNLGRRARLVNAAGTTQSLAPLGSPFVVVSPSGLAAGATAGLDLTFTGPVGQIRRAVARVLAGISSI